MKCKDCVYYKSYFKGFESNPMFENVCMWTLKRNIDRDGSCIHFKEKYSAVSAQYEAELLQMYKKQYG